MFQYCQLAVINQYPFALSPFSSLLILKAHKQQHTVHKYIIVKYQIYQKSKGNQQYSKHKNTAQYLITQQQNYHSHLSAHYMLKSYVFKLLFILLNLQSEGEDFVSDMRAFQRRKALAGNAHF